MTSIHSVPLALGDRSYRIRIGPGLLARGDLLGEHIRSEKAFVVSNPTVAGFYLDRVKASLCDIEVDDYLMPDGEEHKSLATLEEIVRALLEKGHTRRTTVIALGGGVVGDTAGFAAASYQRGVDFIQIPTSLLSQVDSSVGGKTAVNHLLGKNMIGAFHQPRAVYIDTDTLSTLPRREISAGLAEVIKHGLLADVGYLSFVEKNIHRLLALEAGPMAEAIKRSCEIKAAVVAEDEKEAGKRALLNLGHTFGHAIETAMGYGAWLHGEAVGTGLVMATDLSSRLGRCSRQDATRIKGLVAAAGLPVAPPAGMTDESFLGPMAKDKKAQASGMRFVLLKEGPGSSELVDDVPREILAETLAAGKSLCEF